MGHKATPYASTQIYGVLAVITLLVGMLVNYILRPDLFSPSIAYSVMGVQPETKLIFSSSLVVAGLLFYLESHYVYNRLQRLGCYLIAAGFVIVAAVSINENPAIHGLGAFAAMAGLLLNIVIGMRSRWQFLDLPKRIFYLFILGSALSSAVTFILSSGTFHVVALSGYAELSGVVAFAGWAFIDFGDMFSASN